MKSLKHYPDWWRDALLVILFLGIALCARPFNPLESNSGRYLLPLAKSLDPALFQEDAVVEGLSRFGSLFYLALAWALRALQVDQPRLLGAMFFVLCGLKVLQAVALVWLGRGLKADLVARFLIVLWAAAGVPALLGGVELFETLPIHAELALALGLLACGCLVRGQVLPFWGLTGLQVFVHSIMAVQLALTAAPLALWAQRCRWRAHLAGMTAFALCLAAYFLLLSPPRFTPEEAAIFLQAKGDMIHISPAAQSLFAWLKWALLLMLGYLLADASMPAAAGRLLRALALSGSALGLSLATLAVASGNLRLAQLQPMRLFFWVTLFLYLLLSLGIAAQWKARRSSWLFLLAGLVFDITGSLWAYPVYAFSLFQMAWERRTGVDRAPAALSFDPLPRWFLLSCSALLCLVWAASRWLPFTSLGDPIALGVAGVIALLGLRPLSRRITEPVAVVLLGSCLVLGHCQAAWGKHRQTDDVSWKQLGQWCATHSRKADRFMTPPDGNNFRVHALRSSVSEGMSALAWVAPLTFRNVGSRAAQAAPAYAGGRTDLPLLFELARAWGADYVIAKGPCSTGSVPLFVSGPYSVHALPTAPGGPAASGHPQSSLAGRPLK